jgi:hypothetical protein
MGYLEVSGIPYTRYINYKSINCLLNFALKMIQLNRRYSYETERIYKDVSELYPKRNKNGGVLWKEI